MPTQQECISEAIAEYVRSWYDLHPPTAEHADSLEVAS